MAILLNQETKVFTLQTKTSAYQMKVADYGVLLHLYYGRRIGDCDLSYLIQRTDRGFCGNPYEMQQDRTFSLDYFPQEYSCFGIGDYRTDCVKVINGDGSCAVDYRYRSHRILEGKYALEGLPALFAGEGQGETLVIEMEDQCTGMKLELYYGILEEADVITRAAKIINGGEKTVLLKRAMSMCLDFNTDGMDWVHFYGKHTMERELERNRLHHGRQSVGSERGTSSHQHNPFVILCDPSCTEETGECYGAGLIYSGSFLAEAEVDQFHQTRLVMGISPDQFSWMLNPGESFQTPEVALIYSGEGFTPLSHKFHRMASEHLIRGQWAKKRRPILINNWEATYFNFNGEKLLNIAREAKELGIEMLVLDDGWFGKRDSDYSGLGDWTVNEKKLGGSLKELAEKVNALGMKFGLWVEPEMISEDSNLYRSHPDWTMRIPGRPGNVARSQFVLDFSRPEVVDGIQEMIFKILDEVNIEYVKWDFNRSISNYFSTGLPVTRQGEIGYRYMLGLYRFLENLVTRYPHILLEGCSGGGGRFDFRMLYYSPQIWCSDDTDAVERLKIQYGTSFGYPISAVGSHVSASPNHQTGRKTPLETRGTVAMAGSFGYELDLRCLSPEEKEIVRHQIQEYKQHYDLIHEGDYYRLTDPYGDCRGVAWAFVSQDKAECLLCAVLTRLQANPDGVIVKLKGLNPGKRYRAGDKVYTGEALMYGGFLLPLPREEYQSWRFYLKAEE